MSTGRVRLLVRVFLAENKHFHAGRVRNRLLRNNCRLNNFRKFVKQHCRATQQITAAYDEKGEVVFDPEQVTSQVLGKWAGIFSGQFKPVFPDSNLGPLPPLPPDDPLLEGLPSNDPKNMRVLYVGHILCKLCK